VSTRTVFVPKSIYITIIIIYLRLWNLCPLGARFGEIAYERRYGHGTRSGSGFLSHAKSRRPSTCSVAGHERNAVRQNPNVAASSEASSEACYFQLPGYVALSFNITWNSTTLRVFFHLPVYTLYFSIAL